MAARRLPQGGAALSAPALGPVVEPERTQGTAPLVDIGDSQRPGAADRLGGPGHGGGRGDIGPMRLGACIGPLATGHLMPGMMDYRAIVETARDYAIFTTDAEDRIET